MRGVVVMIALGLAGCIDATLLPCGELECAAGDVCTAGGCATPGNVAACDGLTDGAACKTIAGAGGTCLGGSCQSGLCGNGRLDPGEICDLGSSNGTCAGCSANCASDETCGNGIIDAECGEVCDDANANAADGCDACTLTAWSATTVIGESQLATSVGLVGPQSVAVDLLGNLYIADTTNNQILRVDTSGVVTAVAGTGAAGFSGDGGAAVSAQLDTPMSVAVDGLGDIFIADASNARIRRVDPEGIVTTVAGSASAGFGGDGAAATSAKLSFPTGVAVDGLGDIYIADYSNGRVRSVDVATGVITTVAGIGPGGFNGDNIPALTAQLYHPYGVALDGQGDLFIADSNNNRIRRVDPAGIITTVAGTGAFNELGDGGAATAAGLMQPIGVAIDAAGNIFIAEQSGATVRRVDPAGIITTIAGTVGTDGFSGDGGAGTSAELQEPGAVAADGHGGVYIADSDNNRIRWVDAAGIITTVAGNGSSAFGGDGGAATSAQLLGPDGVAVDATGNIYVADTSNHRVRRIDPLGVITTVAGTGVAGTSGDGGAATGAQLDQPYSVALDGLGNLFIADWLDHRIRRVDSAGIITTFAGTGTLGYTGDGGPATGAELHGPAGVAADGSGNVYIADTFNSVIRRVDPAGVITTVAGTGVSGYSNDGFAATTAQLATPFGIALDGAGGLYISDTDNNRVRHVDAGGIITTVAGTGVFDSTGDGGLATSAALREPFGIAVDGHGNLYFADTDNRRVRRVDASTHVITALAGVQGTSGNGGDGGPAASAQLDAPIGIAVDSAGNVLVADSGNNRIRRVAGTGTIATVAGPIDPDGMGPLAHAHLADPRALVIAPAFTLIAGGNSGTVQAALGATAWLEVVAGRYPQATGVAGSARFGDASFGAVSGVAYDAVAQQIYVTESNQVHVVTIVDPADVTTWTIAPVANTAGTAGFLDGAVATATFRAPTGLFLDPDAHQLYVADTGNHVIRAIDLSTGIAAATVRTVAGTPAIRGEFGDGGAATAALLFAPEAITRCANGDLFIADTGNNRVRRVTATTNVISNVLGIGAAVSAGDGSPASAFPVDAPLGLACDASGNLFVTSTSSVRLVLADASGTVDGTGAVQTIYGAPPRTSFPANATSCLTGLAVVDSTAVQIVDACTGLMLELRRHAR